MSSVNRTKISASYSNFRKDINRLRKFDSQNQLNYLAGNLTLTQLDLLVSSVFFTGFRSYENFIREIFLLYTLEKKPRSNSRVRSYISPNNFIHAEQLIKSSMNHLDWNSPDKIIERAELFLQNGFPIKLPVTTNLNALRQYKKLRNHIAHNSVESFEEYKKIVVTYYGVAPLKYPTPGQYLMLSSRVNRANYLLLDFFDVIQAISYDLT